MSEWLVATILAWQCVAAAGTRPASMSATVETLLARAAGAYYDLDLDDAEARYGEALTIAPDDVRAHRGLATVQLLRITFARGTVTTDEFLGGRARRVIDLPPPAPALANAFHEHADRAAEIARAALRQHPRDPDALFEYGASVALVASYEATIEGRVFGAVRSARAAYDAHERVLSLAPGRADAGLVVGMYRYLVSTLSLPGRWLAYLAGFRAERATGLRLVEAAAATAGRSRREAQLALVLLYNRERRYDDALRVLGELRSAHPRNRLFWLEGAATAARAGRHAEAIALLEEGGRLAAGDPRVRARGEDAQRHLVMGSAHLAERSIDAAREHLRLALAADARDWVQARAYLALGQCADLEGRRVDALGAYREAARRGDTARDTATVDAAHRWMAVPFH